MSFFEELQKKVQKGTELARKGTEYALKQAERSLKTEAVKVDISALKKKADRKMMSLAMKAYELYENNNVDNEEMVEICKEIKTLRWQIDEKWNEIDALKKEEVYAADKSQDYSGDDTGKSGFSERNSEPAEEKQEIDKE